MQNDTKPQGSDNSPSPHPACTRNTRGRRYLMMPGEDPRSDFRRDRDRILHSTAFRRLQYKTQVFVFHEGDVFKTRLTHSLEVAQIAQTLALMIGANDELVEAIALAHDIGHPPFGHAGEEALKSILTEHGKSFEHNLQALRIVDALEDRYPDHPGLNLTWETREGIARHSTFFDDPKPPEEFGDFPQGGLECQITNLADMIAYCTHDLEDALEMGFLSEHDVEQDIPLWKQARSHRSVHTDRLTNAPIAERKVRIRYTIRNLIDLLIRDAVAETHVRMAARQISGADDIRRLKQPVVHFKDGTYRQLEALKDYLHTHVYKDPRTLRMTYKGQMILRRLFGVFMKDKKVLPRVTSERLARVEDDAQVIADYIAGMTDRHAMDLYNTLFEPYTSSLHLTS